MMMLCRTFFFFFFAVVQACHPPDQMVVFHVEWPWVILEIFESQSATLTDLCCLPNPNHARSWGSAGSATSSCTSAYPKHKHLTNLLHDLWSYKQIFGLWGSDCFFASRPITRHTSLLEILLEAVVSKCQNHNLTPYLRGPCLAPSLAPHPPPCRSVAPPSRAPAPGRQSLASASGRTVRHVTGTSKNSERTEGIERRTKRFARQLILRRITWGRTFSPLRLFYGSFSATSLKELILHLEMQSNSEASARARPVCGLNSGTLKWEAKRSANCVLSVFLTCHKLSQHFPRSFSRFRTKSLVIYGPICAGCVKTGMLKLYGTLAFYRIHFP